ncbi:Glu/Leu/Phe/Val dehydrogenase dimerization domain-containing protein [Catalinimonas niigatensis]|uniref:Glu/Leu/Phe/Val dehydrogenase dimerization domain-containing protein n=1 Tax=Catalinimonas niigatensis TaxID=1397264 RepID=UPI00266715C6|nr:Glu/Leu/Phe/Val dehydrogenase dimerization domain-containing protein [Catalinimonas niigatensis]WPP53564.1 Glu/Leu/Phe/Val dehydrogenase dimerization domain-containing protein [Catalinimonas niigatensis]
MKQLLKEFEERKPEIVFEWNDPETEAEGWVVINSLRGGAAGGGTRMRKGLNRHEVESLAKTMEIKFTVSGPAIGGAKSGINFNPDDPRKEGVLRRWYRAVTPLLKNYYGTGGDLNVNEVEEVIPITESYGLWHPQEGIVTGHYLSSDPQKIKQLGQLRQGVSKKLEDLHFTPALERKYTVADMATGYGVAQSVIHYYDLWEGKTAGKRAIIQGWGNVGGAAAYYLAKHGIQIVGIIDRNGGLIKTEGFRFEEIRDLLLNRVQNTLTAEGMSSFEEVNEKIWQVGAEVFIPAASSRLVTQEQLSSMIAHGLEVIAPGANVPFKDQEIFFGPIAEYADQHIALIPDFIANCGMARVFAYLMESEIEITDEAIFHDVSQTIREALERIHQQNPQSVNIAKTAFEIALKELLQKDQQTEKVMMG